MSRFPKSKVVTVWGLLCRRPCIHRALPGLEGLGVQEWPRQVSPWASHGGRSGWRPGGCGERPREPLGRHRCFLPAFSHWSPASLESSEAPVLQPLVVSLPLLFLTVWNLFGGRLWLHFLITVRVQTRSTAWPQLPPPTPSLSPSGHSRKSHLLGKVTAERKALEVPGRYFIRPSREDRLCCGERAPGGGALWDYTAPALEGCY